MRAGGLDRQISIWKKSVTQDSTYGSEVITWIPLVPDLGSPVDAVRFWAEVQDALPSRDEGLKQGLVIAANRTRIRMRYRNDITSDMQVIVYGDTNATYQIIGGPAMIEGRKERMEIMCEKYSS